MTASIKVRENEFVKILKYLFSGYIGKIFKFANEIREVKFVEGTESPLKINIVKKDDYEKGHLRKEINIVNSSNIIVDDSLSANIDF